jgi:hypothetical protein
MKTATILAVLLGGALTLSAAETQTDCRSVSQPLKKAVKGKPVEDMLKLLEKEVTATPKCSCELILSAIMGYKPKPNVVASMVDTAINAAPDYMEVIVMCALAAAPDAEAEILAVANKFGYTPNPLNFPGLPGQGPGGQFLEGANTPIFVNPPEVTTVNPN